MHPGTMEGSDDHSDYVSEYWCLIQSHIINLNAVNLVSYHSGITLFSSHSAQFISEIQSVDMLDFCEIMWVTRELLYVCVNTDDVVTHVRLLLIFLCGVLWCLFVGMLLFEWPFPSFIWIWRWMSFSSLFATYWLKYEIIGAKVLLWFSP